MKRIISNIKRECRIVGRIKALTIVEIGQRVHPCGATLLKSGNFCHFGAFPPQGTYWREILLGQADPHAPRLCQISRESVQRVAPVGENVDFWPVGKFNTGSLPLCGRIAGRSKSHDRGAKPNKGQRFQICGYFRSPHGRLRDMAPARYQFFYSDALDITFITYSTYDQDRGIKLGF